MHQAVERMRAGEHHVLQSLVAPPQPAVLLTTSAWLPVLRGEVRLFSGGLYVETEQHGPHILPFRIHLDAVGAFQIGSPSEPGLLMLRQKADDHAYGPLSLLPEAPSVAEGVDKECLPMRTFNLALVVPPRSALQRALVDTVWPIWEVLFRDCKVPCDQLAAPAAEFRYPLEVLRRAGGA